MTGPLPAWLLPVTVPMSWIYGAAVAARNARFDRGGAARIGVPVISVGNLTTGGAGKTPMVAWIARLLEASGLRPVIAMRGYGARPPDESDEQAEYAMLLAGVPVVAHPDRLRALGEWLARHPETDCALLDDGFQHRRLRRDLDLVLLDATRGTLSDRLLPAGHLREPIENLKRASAVVITRAAAIDDALAEAVARCHGRRPVAWSRHRWTGLLVAGADTRTEPVEWLAGKRVLAMLGVAHPDPIRRQIREAGAAIAVEVKARDHEHYDQRKVARAQALAAGLDAIVVTGKDWVKVRHHIDHAAGPPVAVPRLEIEVFAGSDALEALLLEAAGRP